MGMLSKIIFPIFLLCGCAISGRAPDNLMPMSVGSYGYEVAVWGRGDNPTAPVHIYIEGDGNSFDSNGVPTDNPTPHSHLVRDMAAASQSENVFYLARPCQFVMSPQCNVRDWTTGRFSAQIVDTMADAVRKLAGNRPVVLIGYSGGAMISGLIVFRHPDIDVRTWVTVAGVLNHTDWTEYFGDSPLSDSLDLNELPRIHSLHYVAEYDEVVPRTLSQKWVGAENLIIVPGATHSQMKNLKLYIDKM